MARMFGLLKWFCFAALLTAVGVPVFHFVRHRPRCTITGIGDVPHLSADGSRLVTLKPRSNNTIWLRGPLQIWSTHSGRVKAEFFGDVGIDWLETSPDGQTLAASLTDGTVHLIDFQLGERWQVEGAHGTAMLFSPDGRWFTANGTDEQPSSLVDVPARKTALRLHVFTGFSSDRHLGFAQGDSEIDMWDQEAKTDVWHLESGVKSGTLRTGLGRVGATSHDLLVFRTGIRKSRGPDKGFRETGIDLWDLTTFTRRWSWRHSAANKLQVAFSPDGKTLARWLRDQPVDSQLALVDAATGRPRWSTMVKQMYAGGFSGDGALWFVWQLIGAGKLTVFDAATGDILWEKSGRPVAARFVGVDRILHHEHGASPALLNARTGQVIAALPLYAIRDDDPDAEGAIIDLKVSSDGRYFAYSGWTQHKVHDGWRHWLEKWRLRLFGEDAHGVVVMDSATGRELRRVLGAGSRFILLSDDGSTLVTVDESSSDGLAVRVWDVSAARAWRWSLTVAAAVGCVILAARWAWRRRARANTVAASPIPTPAPPAVPAASAGPIPAPPAAP